MEIEREQEKAKAPFIKPTANRIPRHEPLTDKKDPTAVAKDTKARPKAPETYASEVSMLLGFICLTIGLVGFVVDNFLSARFGPIHSWIFVLTAVPALVVGYIGKKPVRFFSYIVGALYLGLGIAGFVLGQVGTTTFGSLVRDRFIWTLLPNQLAFGTNDHILHLVIGALFVIGASLKKKTPKSGVYF